MPIICSNPDDEPRRRKLLAWCRPLSLVAALLVGFFGPGALSALTQSDPESSPVCEQSAAPHHLYTYSRLWHGHILHRASEGCAARAADAPPASLPEVWRELRAMLEPLMPHDEGRM